jgi:hypothetical protein
MNSRNLEKYIMKSFMIYVVHKISWRWSNQGLLDGNGREIIAHIKEIRVTLRRTLDTLPKSCLQFSFYWFFETVVPVALLPVSTENLNSSVWTVAWQSVGQHWALYVREQGFQAREIDICLMSTVLAVTVYIWEQPTRTVARHHNPVMC